MKLIIPLVLALTIFFAACKSKETTNTNNQPAPIEVAKTISVIGNYVGEGYEKRAEGYDWVGVMVQAVTDTTIKVSVRSRIDKKKATCTFDAVAAKSNDSTYIAKVNKENVTFSFANNTLKLSTDNTAVDNALVTYCSGGGSMHGLFTKIEGPLDSTQVDKTTWQKLVTYGNYNMLIKATMEEGQQRVYCTAFDVPIKNQTAYDTIQGEIYDADAGDLNQDGYPEVMVYSRNVENQKGQVKGFTVDKKNGVAKLYFKPTSERLEIAKGYNGNDEFEIVEHAFVQKFPLYENGKRTGKNRQVQYKMVKGKPSQFFEVVDQFEF